MKRLEVEVDGQRYKLRELTLGEASEISDATVVIELDEQGRMKPRINIGQMRLLLLKKCIEEPILKDKDILDLPYSTARKLLDKCIELNPEFKGI
ncbi:MAG: hypothetical protein QXY39_01865 [Thermofilaceae archaeon]